jgi:N-acetyl-anhydromuramyl-L-alanine amidase AmpD
MIAKKYAASIATLLLAVVAAAAPVDTPNSPGKIIDRLMPETHSAERPSTATVDTILLHFSSDVIKNPENPFSVERIIQIYTDYRVSTHYLVDREGRIYRLVPEERVAFHAGKGELARQPSHKDSLNYASIGIEILAIGSEKDMRIFMNAEKYRDLAKRHPEFVGYTDAQYEAVNWLVREIAKRHPAVKLDRSHIIGHDEYAYGRKTDPGELFDYTRLGLPAQGLPPVGSTAPGSPSGPTTAPIAR